MKVIGYFCAFMAVTGAIVTVTGSGESVTTDAALTIVFSLMAWLLLATSKQRKAKKTLEEQRRRFIGEKDKCVETLLALVDGLPSTAKTSCTVSVTEQELLIRGNLQTFRIALNQMIAVQCKADFELEREATDSNAQGVDGGLPFQPVGAVDESWKKTKRTTTSTYYLIINYWNQAGETAVLAFESLRESDCKKIAAALTKHNTHAYAGKTMQI